MKKQYEMPMGQILLCAEVDIIRTSDLLNYTEGGGVGDVLRWDEL